MAEYIILDEFLSEEAKESADAQGHLHKLVRCKDCKKHGSEDCTLWTDAVEFETADDWFCADGERKDGEQE